MEIKQCEEVSVHNIHYGNFHAVILCGILANDYTGFFSEMMKNLQMQTKGVRKQTQQEYNFLTTFCQIQLHYAASK